MSPSSVLRETIIKCIPHGSSEDPSRAEASCPQCNQLNHVPFIGTFIGFSPSLSHCPYSGFLTLVCWDHLLSKPSPKTLSQVPLLGDPQVRQLILEVVLESTSSTWDSGTPLTSEMATGTPL